MKKTLVVLSLLSVGLIGCQSQVDNFVNGAQRNPASVLGPTPFPNDTTREIKVSPGHALGGGQNGTYGGTLTATTTQHNINGSHYGAQISINASRNQ